VKGRFAIYALRTNRALTVLVSLQPINMKYSRDADAHVHRVTGSTCSGQFSSVQFSSSAVNKSLVFGVSVELFKTVKATSTSENTFIQGLEIAAHCDS